MFRVTFYAVVVGIGLWIASMRLDDHIPYDYLSGTIQPDPAKEGRRVVLNWKIQTHRLCPGSVQRVLTNETTGKVVAAYDPTPASLTVSMGDTELNKTFLLPDDLPPLVGYDATVCFKCNPLQAFFPICFKTPHLTFRVIQ